MPTGTFVNRSQCAGLLVTDAVELLLGSGEDELSAAVERSQCRVALFLDAVAAAAGVSVVGERLVLTSSFVGVLVEACPVHRERVELGA
ncbi:hypothetical protein [Pseudonocardia sp. ICBG1293]|uniref:hypothetical protein n=1 Tax=Pseudonocardia sp. ICBG1293 TaxID=2844382 RepID=UPI0015BBD8AE|nr:hypothetical protein [Pseudonocardia sp. ICBG1293]NWJ69669.1 hypothetical protein [Pseudonocardia pini]